MGVVSKSLIRGVGVLSRRLDRPEILAVVDAAARRDQRDDVAGRTIVSALIRPTSSFVDVGTNRGQWLEPVVRCAPNGRHLAFEAIPELCERTAKRFPSVDLRAVALAEAAGETQFCHFRNLDGFSGLRRRPEIADETEWISVRLARLDDEIDDLEPALIKIDVEGAEINVLLGAVQTLAVHRPFVVFEHQNEVSKLYQRTSEDLWEIFGDLNYRIFELQGTGPYNRDEFMRSAGRGNIVNWLAVPG